MAHSPLSPTFSQPPSTSPASDTDRPDPLLMPQYIDAFFKHLGPQYPFLSHERIVGQFMENSLTPGLSCMIACLASPYTAGAVQAAGVDPQQAMKRYLLRAQDLTQNLHRKPCFDNLQILILLAHAEVRLNAKDRAHQHAAKAVEHALALGVTDERSRARLVAAGADGSLLNALYASIGQLLMLLKSQK